MDAIELLTAEHDRIRSLCRELRAARRSRDSGTCDELLRVLRTTLAVHADIEHEVIYPAVRRLGAAEAESVQDAKTAHDRIEALLGSVTPLDPADERSAEAIETATAMLDDHLRREEQELFPVLRERAGDRLAAQGPLLASIRRNSREDAMLPQLLAFALRTDACCIDIGCNRGRVLREMLRQAPRGRHIAYEPIPALAIQLRAAFPTVDVRQAAASDVDGEAPFVHVAPLDGYSGLDRRHYPEHITDEDLEWMIVRTERLDSSLEEGWAPDFVKIDVEGSENRVIAGAMHMLATCRPVVVLEHEPTDEAETMTLWRLLVEHLDYRIHDYCGGGPYSRDELLASVAAAAHTNYLARP